MAWLDLFHEFSVAVVYKDDKVAALAAVFLLHMFA
jgi:hypothetical protein